jgi:hypothetical protein
MRLASCGKALRGYSILQNRERASDRTQLAPEARQKVARQALGAPPLGHANNTTRPERGAPAQIGSMLAVRVRYRQGLASQLGFES